jgi:L-alanine-DL-glutamate epimerase-like enolase superfamily enzyme
MLVMLGCMVETSLGISAAAQISGLVDFVDLDGAMLLADDPYSGPLYENGLILLPDGPGLGVVPR